MLLMLVIQNAMTCVVHVCLVGPLDNVKMIKLMGSNDNHDDCDDDPG